MHINFLNVSLGIQLKNEANMKDVADIMDSLNDYMPMNELLIQ